MDRVLSTGVSAKGCPGELCPAGVCLLKEWRHQHDEYNSHYGRGMSIIVGVG